jgi:predicted transcriptional regulator
MEVKKGSVRAELMKVLDSLPNDLIWEDLQYHIYVRQKLERGIADIEAGRVFSHKEVKRHFQRLSKKWR